MSGLLDEGPFFHGTIADLRVDEFLTAGRPSNYRPEISRYVVECDDGDAPTCWVCRGGA